jgi:large conductance mechanosensitive channel
MKILKEFREFTLRGNVIDLAVGVIIGGAFDKIVKSIIDDLIMPVIGVIVGSVDFTNLYLPLTPALAKAKAAAALNGPGLNLLEAKKLNLGPVLAYGSFLTVLTNFAILAFCIFLMIKAMNRLRRHEASKPQPAPPEEVLLLREIRDSLRAGTTLPATGAGMSSSR